MDDFKTIHNYTENTDVRITMSLSNYQIESLKKFIELFGDSYMTADVEFHTGDELTIYGNIKKIEIEKEKFE